jgi:heat-inducible transcriptional repressor
MISERQEKLLNFLVKEYLTQSKPVSSLALKEIVNLDICGATIRNDLQALTEQGFITQPHISAGRVPTQKAYKYIADKIEEDFIVRQIKEARREMQREMQMMEEIMQTLEQDNIFDILNILDKWNKKI